MNFVKNKVWNGLAVIMILLPFFSSFVSAVPVVADTTEGKSVTIFANQQGSATIAYQTDATDKKIQWTLTVQKNQQSESNQLGFYLKNQDQPVPLTAVASNNVPFKVDTNSQALLESKASPSFAATTITFTTDQIDSLNIQGFLLTAKDAPKTTLLGDNCQLTIVHPDETSKDTATDSSTVTKDTQASETTTNDSSNVQSSQTEAASTKSKSKSDTASSTVEEASAIPSPGHATTDIAGSDENLLGIAQNFHIFANQATINTHMNGNIAVKNLAANANFGTNIHSGAIKTDISYIQSLSTIANSSFVSATGSRTNKVVFGPNVDISLEDQNHQPAVYINNQRMDHLKTDEVFQDSSASDPYIDFDQTFAQLRQTSTKLGQFSQSAGVTKDFTDNNQRVVKLAAATPSTGSVVLTVVDDYGLPLPGALIELEDRLKDKTIDEDVTDNEGKVVAENLPIIGPYAFIEEKAPTGYQIDPNPLVFVEKPEVGDDQKVIVTLTKAELEQNTPITISGISKNKGVIINVDTEGASEVNIQSQIKLNYLDGNNRNNQETEDFDDSVVLWNFINRSKDQTITFNSPFQGTVLAPDDTIRVQQNLDGSIIANNVLINSDSHRWDMQTNEATPSTLQLRMVNKKFAKTTIDVSGTKTWKDNQNQYNTRPDSITVDLLQNGTKIASQDVKADAKGNWSYTFTDVPKTDDEGQEYNYTIREETVKGYETKVDGMNLINSYQGEMTTIKGTKTWEDNQNQYNTRPDSITVDLLQNGTKVASQVVKENKNGEWTYTFTDVPKTDATGKEYNYTISEEAVKGYETKVDGMNLINSYQGEMTTIKGTKTWEDNQNKYNTRPDSITVNLLQNGTKVASQVVKADAEGNWTYEFNDVPKTDAAGKEYNYTISEEAVKGYETKVDGMNLINSYQGEMTTIKGTKTWEDNQNQYNTRPDSITVDLLQNGTKVASQVVKADAEGNWTYAFTDVPKTDTAGKAYQYTISEEAVKGYETKVDGMNLINSYQGQVTTIKGTKTWEDNQNQYNTRPNSITVNLLQNGTKVASQDVKADAKGNWTYAFTDVPKTDAAGKEYNYTISEEAVKGYETKVDGMNLINSYHGEVTTIKGTKTWEDNQNKYNTRPDSITVNLLQNGTKVASQVVKADAKGNWTYAFNDVPKTDTTGKEYNYTISEEAIKGYETKVDGMNLINSYQGEMTTIKGTKTWEDNQNQYNTRPDSITVNLLQNGTKVASQVVKADAKGNWTYSFTDVPKTDATGKEYNYKISEEAVKGYETKIDGMNLINSYQGEMTTIKGTKTWEDNQNQYNTRPDSITVNLLQNGTKVGSQVVKADAEGNWTYAFTDVPKTDAAGKAYQYTIREEAVKGYETKIDGMNLINSYQGEVTTISGEKIWKDNNDHFHLRPEKITIQLMQNGQPVAETSTSAERDWQYQFDQVPQYDAAGNEYTYQVKEKEIPTGYQSTVNGFTIINTLEEPAVDPSNPDNHSGGSSGAQDSTTPEQSGAGDTDPSTSGSSESSTKDYGDQLTEKSEASHSKAAKLPQTNERKSYGLTILGILLLLIVGYATYQRRKK